MAYELVESAGRSYAVDWSTVWRIVQSYVRIRAQNAHAQIVNESQRSLVNPLSWNLPNLFYVEVDWQKVNDEAKVTGLVEFCNIRETAYSSMPRAVNTLRLMQQETRKARDTFRWMQRSTGRRTMEEIDTAVSKYESGEKTARLVRDVAGGTLLVGATVVSGGSAAAGWAVLAGGSGLKAVGKYQDTGDIGSATIELAQNLIVGGIPVARAGQALKGSGKILITVFDAGTDTAQSLIEGNSVAQSLTLGGVPIAGAGMGIVLDSKLVSAALEKTAVPIVSRVVSSLRPGDAIKLSQGLIKTSGKEALKLGVKNAFSNWSQGESVIPQKATVLDRAVIVDDWYLKLAVIDMQLGIAM